MASNPPAKDSATSVRGRRRCQPSFPGSSPVLTALSWCPAPPVQPKYKLNAIVKYTVKVYRYDVHTMLVNFDVDLTEILAQIKVDFIQSYQVKRTLETSR